MSQYSSKKVTNQMSQYLSKKATDLKPQHCLKVGRPSTGIQVKRHKMNIFRHTAHRH
jgi:hypothetical protein